jgi:release factor glutamine methyltransferase
MHALYNQYKVALQHLYTPHEISMIFRACVAEVLQVSEQKTYFLSDLSYTQAHLQRLQSMLTQLQAHTPLQYVLGYETFMGLSFAVSPAVLIPRPETAQLVQLIIDQHQHQKPLRVLDVGSGSGCIAVSLAHYLPQAQVTAVDISQQALQVASKNAHSIGVNIQCKQLDFLTQSSQLTNTFDVLVSNPPYITHAEKAHMENNVLNHEPHLALFVPDSDPLLFYRAIAQFATQRQVPHVYLEINRAFGPQTCALFQQNGYQTNLLQDLFDNPRMVEAHLP